MYLAAKDQKLHEAYVIFAPMNTTSLQLHLVEQATTVNINKDQ